MKYNGIVHGNAAWAQPILVIQRTVYVHENIVQKYDEDGFPYYECEETEYPMDEYWQLLQSQQ